MYVKRDVTGRIIATYPNLQPGRAEEEVADDDPSLASFLTFGLAKTPDEIDALRTSQCDFSVVQDGLLKALALALFQTVNDVRVLKGQATITAPQFKSFLKGLL